MRVLHLLALVMFFSSVCLTYPVYPIGLVSHQEVYEPVNVQGFEECTSVIVTGSAAKDGRAILMKNRDSSQILNVPIYNPATNTSFAYVAVNSMWMGINEKGLAVMNTAMPALSDSPNPGSFNGELNRRILKYCKDVPDLKEKLNDRNSLLYPDPEFTELSIATCVGVVDKKGNGAFFEIGDDGYSVENVVNSYQSRANHPRTYPGLASGPSGRDADALEVLDEIFQEKGVISWKDVAQRVSRYVSNRETITTSFTVNGEICNDNTVSAMVAVSGDDRYDGGLNIMWGEYGRIPIVGVFVPSMVYSGLPPVILNDMVSYTQEKEEYAHGVYEDMYISSRVREIQNYSFAAENYAFEQYDRLMDQIPLGLSEVDLNKTLKEFIDLTVSVSVDMYVNESYQLPDYARQFNVTAIPEITDTSTTSIDDDHSTAITDTSGTISTNTSNATVMNFFEAPEFLPAAIGFSSGIIAMIVLIAYINRKWS